MITLRHYQKTMVAGIRNSFIKGFKKVLAVLPTGGGKTVVFTFLSQAMGLKGKRAIILVHRVELLRQTSEALDKFDVVHGIINPQFTPNFKHNIQNASVQTIIKRLKYLASLGWVADVLIIDEAHHANSKTWQTIISHFEEMNPNLLVVGVTATPIRGDGQGLGVSSGGMFEDMVIGPQASELMDEGFLVRAKVFGPPEKLDLSGVKTQMGDYQAKELSKLVDKPKITGDAVDHYRELCPNAPCIVFCVSVSHAEHVAQQFRDAGYRFYSVDGSMDDETRKKLINGLSTGSVQGLTSCDLISEGTDIPRATVAIELRPTKSKGLNMQQRGRVLRPVYADGYDLSTKEGRLAAIANSEKPYAIILDHVGNSEEHGLPNEIHEWSLEGSKKKRGSKNQEQAVKVVMCESCFMHQEPTSVCIGCGHVMKPPKDNTPKQVEGKLREITEEILAEKRGKKIEVAKTQGIEELLKIAADRGYKPGWAHNINMAREKKLEKLAKLQPVEMEFMEVTEIIDVEGNLNDSHTEEHESATEEHEFSDDLNF